MSHKAKFSRFRPKAVVLGHDIPFGHKFALRPIPMGGSVIKYGEIIGVASQSIAPGDHVHVHNVDGTRGRGDGS
jgi:altronate dehydratase small subunit